MDITNARGDIAERLLAEELQKYFSNRIVLVLQGGSFRAPGKGKGAIQEHDFVIVDREHKVIICLESKVTLTGSTGNKAIEQTKKCQKLLEEYCLRTHSKPVVFRGSDLYPRNQP